MTHSPVSNTGRHDGLIELVRRTFALPVRTHPVLLCDGLLQWIDRRRWWLWTAVLLMYAAGFNGQWRIQPDAALYLSLGRNLAEGRGYTYLGEPHRLAYPGWPMLIAGTFKLFGSSSLVPVNIVETLIALATVAVVHRLILLHAGRPTAVAVSVGVGLTKAFYCYGFELWADMLFTLGAMACLAGYEGIIVGGDRSTKRRLTDAAFLIGGLLTALVTRPTIWPLLLALGCALPIDAVHRRIRWRSVGVILAVVLVAAGVIFFGGHHFGANYARDLFNRLTGSAGEGLGRQVTANLASLLTWAASDVLFQVRLGRFVNSFLSIVVLLMGFGLFRHRSLWGFWFCLLLGTILVSQTTLDRYFLPALPLLVFAWWEALVWINRKLSFDHDLLLGNLAFLGLLGFGCLMNFTKVCGIIMQQHERPFLAYYDQGTYELTPEFAKNLAAFTEPDSIVLVRVPYGRVTAYLSRRNVQGAVGLPPPTAGHAPVYVIEPLDNAIKPVDDVTQSYLTAAALAVGPALFTVSTRRPGAAVREMSLHATVPLR